MEKCEVFVELVVIRRILEKCKVSDLVESCKEFVRRNVKVFDRVGSCKENLLEM